jgi:uncharacterized integral membrane protein
MNELLRWLLGLAVTAAVVLFAIANRAVVPVTWSPVASPVNIPVYALVLGGAVIGFLIGGALVWLNAGALRQERRRQKKRIDRLEQQLAEPGDEL